MKRELEISLIEWKHSSTRLPLIIRGARQVGKTYLIEAFGKAHFKSIVTINFELRPDLIGCFKNFDPKHIVQALELILDIEIIPSETLLFLDEIQECPDALMALRYFKEQLPELAVIAAGSLLEFSLESESFRMPVGRVRQLYLHSLSFCEFLEALGKTTRLSYIKSITLSSFFDEAVHKALLEDFRLYLVLGGMPAVVQEYIRTNSLKSCQILQTAIVNAYRHDFAKYAKKSQMQHIQHVYNRVPRLIGQAVKYSSIDSDSRSREIKAALNLLIKAKILSPVYTTTASGVPLGATYKETVFKLLWMDVGLLQNLCGLETDIFEEKELLQINRGAITEQAVGQSLLTALQPDAEPQLFYWQREKKNSQAEVDYVISRGSRIYPVEVKSGKTGRLKSLQIFMAEKQSPLGIHISSQPLGLNGDVLSVPLYLSTEIFRLLDHIPQKGVND